MKSLFVLLLVMVIDQNPMYAQSQYKRMIVHNGGDSLKLRISRVDSVTFDCSEEYTDMSSVNWGGKISGDAYFENFEYENISTYTHENALSYYDFFVDGNTTYAVTATGIRKIDYSDKQNPNLIDENIPFPTNTNLQGRSIVHKGNNLYVGYRVSWNNYKLDNAQITEKFETKGVDPDGITTDLSNNSMVNGFFKKITLSRDIAKIHQLFIFKAYKRSETVYSNVILFKVNGEKDLAITSTNYSSREEALAALKDNYKTANGDYCEVDWSVIPEGNNTISDVIFNFVSNTLYEHSQNADYSISNEHCPNSGNHSASFTINSTTSESAIINHYLIDSTTKAETSFWIYIDQPFSGEVKIPLFKNDVTTIMELTISTTGNTFALSMENNVSTKEFLRGVWYNIKASYSNGDKTLYYRSKECSDWVIMGTAASDCKEINNITIGITGENTSAKINIDDFRYSSYNVDEVSYDKGKITIVDKNTLLPKKILNVEYPVTGMSLYRDRLVVAGLDGINVYSVIDADNPELVYSYRPSVFRDMQNTKIYEHNGHIYAFICKYTRGYMILDLTDINNIFIAKDDECPDLKYQGYSKAIYCYDALVDYPYVYTTIAPHPSYSSKIPEACGVMSINIADLNNISKSLYLINPDDITTNKKGDTSPTRIAKYGNTLYLNNRDRGLAVFNILGDGVLEYKGLVEFNNETSINCISITENGLIYLGDDTTNGTYRNVNLWRIVEE